MQHFHSLALALFVAVAPVSAVLVTEYVSVTQYVYQNVHVYVDTAGVPYTTVTHNMPAPLATEQAQQPQADSPDSLEHTHADQSPTYATITNNVDTSVAPAVTTSPTVIEVTVAASQPAGPAEIVNSANSPDTSANPPAAESAPPAVTTSPPIDAASQPVTTSQTAAAESAAAAPVVTTSPFPVAPIVSSAPAEAPASAPAPSPAPSPSSAPAGMDSAEAPPGEESPEGPPGEDFSGEATFYSTGLGACGWTNSDGDMIAALNFAQFNNFGMMSNGNPVCGRKARLTRGGKSVDVTIADKCPGCKVGDLDLSPAAFNAIASEDEGRVAISWSFL